MTIKKMLNRFEAAEYLGLKPKTLENWQHKKIGPRMTKIGGAVRYDIADLDAYIAEQKRLGDAVHA